MPGENNKYYKKYHNLGSFCCKQIVLDYAQSLALGEC